MNQHSRRRPASTRLDISSVLRPVTLGAAQFTVASASLLSAAVSAEVRSLLETLVLISLYSASTAPARDDSRQSVAKPSALQTSRRPCSIVGLVAPALRKDDGPLNASVDVSRWSMTRHTSSPRRSVGDLISRPKRPTWRILGQRRSVCMHIYQVTGGVMLRDLRIAAARHTRYRHQSRCLLQNEDGFRPGARERARGRYGPPRLDAR